MEKFKNNIKKEIFSLSETIENLTSLNKEIKKEELNIKNIIQETLEKFQNKMKDINLKIQIDDFKIVFNKNALIQILTIILNNAIEALKNKDNKIIEIKTYKQNSNIILIIKDNGDGIKEINKIFEPYYSTKSKNEKGLSLFIAKSLAERLEAKIEAKNDNGALFKIIFKAKV